MVSTDVIRTYPFFAGLDEASIRFVASITDKVPLKPGDVLFKSGELNRFLYLLIDGAVETSLDVDCSSGPNTREELYIDDINPGEVFGLSALAEPYFHSSTARVSRAGILLRIDATKFHHFCDTHPRLGYGFMKLFMKTALERLENTRVLLAAARLETATLR